MYLLLVNGKDISYSEIGLLINSELTVVKEKTKKDSNK